MTTNAVLARVDQMSFDLVIAPKVDEAPRAPLLAPLAARHQAYPFPGMTPEDCARSAIANSEEFADAIAWTLRCPGAGGPRTASQILAALPQDWRDLLGKWAHGSLTQWRARARGIRETYVAHDGGHGFHFSYVIETTGGAQHG